MKKLIKSKFFFLKNPISRFRFYKFLKKPKNIVNFLFTFIKVIFLNLSFYSSAFISRKNFIILKYFKKLMQKKKVIANISNNKIISANIILNFFLLFKKKNFIFKFNKKNYNFIKNLSKKNVIRKKNLFLA